MISPCVRVPEERANEARLHLVELDLLRTDLRVKREGGHVLFPVREEAPGALLGYRLTTAEFESQARPRSYKDVVKVPQELAPLLPASFDSVGDILVVKLSEPLLPHRQAIGEALLLANRHARVVLLDRGVKDEFRVRELEVIAGEERFTTVHSEYGTRFHVDLSRAYFSPRLATEHHRVATQVRAGEVVFDLFAGVGPFAILIAKKARPSRVYAVDLNPDAIALLRENIEANKVKGVIPVLGDACDVANAHAGQADRVILNLPQRAAGFLDAALAVAKPEATIHHHAILETGSEITHAREMAERAGELGWRLAPVAYRTVRNYSPGSKHYAIDFHAVRGEDASPKRS